MLVEDLPEYSVVADGANEKLIPLRITSVSAVGHDGHLKEAVFPEIPVNGYRLTKTVV